MLVAYHRSNAMLCEQFCPAALQMQRPPGAAMGQYVNSVAASAAAAAAKRPRMDGQPRPPFLHGPSPMLAPAYGAGAQARMLSIQERACATFICAARAADACCLSR